MAKPKAREVKRKKWTLSVHLLRPEVKTNEAALRPRSDSEEVSRRDVPLDEAVIKGRLIATTSRPRPPDWKALLDQATPQPITGLSVSSASALLLTKVQGRMFALTWGHAWRMLDPDAIDAGFGLRVVLNSVDPDKLRSMDLANFEAVSRLKRTQVSRGSPIDNFGIDPAQDLLRELVGEPRDRSFATRVAGSDALHITTDITLKEVPAKLGQALAISQETTYKQHFAWVDHLSLVKGEKHHELDQLLVAAINDEDDTRIHLAPGEIVDWSRLDKFRYAGDGPGTRHDELELFEYKATHHEITIDNLRDDEVIAYDADGTEQYRWPVYSCLVAEITGPDDATYALLQGRWYRADPDYAASIDEAIKSIPTTKITMPNAFTIESERVYNTRVCNESKGKLVLLDGITIPYGGRSKVEPCDILTDDKSFIHVKKGTKSANLSHLFMQGTVSAEAFRLDKDYREKLRGHLKKPHVQLVPKDAPKASDYTICYAIATKPKVKIPAGLPFFSRVSLMQSVRLLGGYGYDYSVAQIKIQA